MICAGLLRSNPPASRIASLTLTSQTSSLHLRPRRRSSWSVYQRRSPSTVHQSRKKRNKEDDNGLPTCPPGYEISDQAFEALQELVRSSGPYERSLLPLFYASQRNERREHLQQSTQVLQWLHWLHTHGPDVPLPDRVLGRMLPALHELKNLENTMWDVIRQEIEAPLQGKRQHPRHAFEHLKGETWDAGGDELRAAVEDGTPQEDKAPGARFLLALVESHLASKEEGAGDKVLDCFLRASNMDIGTRSPTLTPACLVLEKHIMSTTSAVTDPTLFGNFQAASMRVQPLSRHSYNQMALFLYSAHMCDPDPLYHLLKNEPNGIEKWFVRDKGIEHINAMARHALRAA